DLIIKRNPDTDYGNLRTIFFYNNEEVLKLNYNNEENIPFSQKNSSAIQLSTNDLRSSIRFPAGRTVHDLVVCVNADKLQTLLSIHRPNSTIRTITAENASYLFFVGLDPEMQLLLKNIAAVNMNNPLNNFYVKIKVEELLYLLFAKLSLRENTRFKNIN